MSYGERHPIDTRYSKEKFLIGLSLRQMGWLGLGGFLSIQLMQRIPAIPHVLFPMNHTHNLIPFLFFAFLAFARQPQTGLTYPVYLISFIKNAKLKKLPYLKYK